MGQSSSQVAPSQVADSTQPPMSSNTAMGPPPKPKRKRESESEGSEGSVRLAKKFKRDAKRSSKERKINRAVPQHRRGTSIRPLEEESLNNSQATVEPIGDTITVTSPDDKAHDSQAPAEVVEEVIAVSVPKKSKKKKSKENDEPQLKDGIVVNGTGTPGPGKKKRKKDKADGTPIDVPETSQSPQRIFEQSRAEPKPEAPVDTAHAEGGAEISEVEDEIVVSPVGQPGPKHKDKKERKEAKRERKRQRAAAQAKPSEEPTPPATQPDTAEVPATVVDVAEPKQKKAKKKKTPKDSELHQEAASAPQQNVTVPNRPRRVRQQSPSGIRPLTPSVTPSEGEDDVAHEHEPEAEDEYEADYDASYGNGGPVEPTERFQEWLDDQLAAPEPEGAPPKKKTKKSKKSAARVEANDPDVLVDDGMPPSPRKPPDPELPPAPEMPPRPQMPPAPEMPPQPQLPPAPEMPPQPEQPPPLKKQAVADGTDTRPVAMRQFGTTAERGTVTGKWSQEELNLADKIFHDFCKHNGIAEAQLRLKTTDWANLGPFKIRLYEAFPGRQLAVIRKHMQRRFSPYEKGAWSEEETQRLKDAYAKYPEQWPQIAKEVERDVQACRDRWHNQVMYEKSMDRGPWSIEEETTLIRVVEEAITEIMKETDDPKIRHDRTQAESVVNWREVAKKMDGKRSQKRCFEKWRLLRRRRNRAVTQPTPTPFPKPTIESNRPSRKAQTVERLYANMTEGDIYACLYELARTLNMMPPSGYHDDSTFWSVFPQHRQPEHVYLYTPLVRYTFLSALETYGGKRLRKADTYQKKLQAVLTKMYHLSQKGKVDLKDRFYGADNKAEVVVKRKSARKVVDSDVEDGAESEDKADTTGKRKSAAKVVESDVEDEVAEEAEEASEAITASNAGDASDGQDPSHAGDAEDDDNVDDIPATQSEQGGGAEEEDTASLRSDTPLFSSKAFLKKCKKAGKKQHRAYLKGYGR